MKGLLIKDKLTLTKKLSPVSIVITVVFFLVLIATLKGTGVLFIGIILPMFVPSVAVTLYNCDEQWKWDKYAISLPVTKTQIVCSRYVFCGIVLVVCALLAFVLNLCMYLLFHELSLIVHLAVPAFGLLAGLVYLLLIIPASYIWGQSGGSTVMLALVALALGGTYTIRAINPGFTLPTVNQAGLIAVLVSFGMILLGYVSVKVSVRTYIKNHS